MYQLEINQNIRPKDKTQDIFTHYNIKRFYLGEYFDK